MPLRRAYKRAAALTIGQRRADDLGKDALRHIRDLVHDSEVEVDASQAGRVLAAQQAYPGAVG